MTTVEVVSVSDEIGRGSVHQNNNLRLSADHRLSAASCITANDAPYLSSADRRDASKDSPNGVQANALNKELTDGTPWGRPSYRSYHDDFQGGGNGTRKRNPSKESIGQVPVLPLDVLDPSVAEQESISSSHENWRADVTTSQDSLGQFFSALSAVILVFFLYAGALCMWDFKYFVPYDSGFAIVCLWGGSMLGSHAARAVGAPPLLGMLIAGIVLKNCGDPVRGLKDEWAAVIRAFGLMNILMRGGLEMDVGAVSRVGLAVVRLTVMPGVAEAFATAIVAVLVFEMPFFLALCMGFIIAAVSPAVVVGGMFDLQARGYGVAQGIPSLVVAAASFDDVVAISGFSMCIGLAIGGKNIVLEALHGPINIIAGAAAGFAGAAVLSCTKLWNTRLKRTLALLLIGVTFTFLSKYLHFAGAGALAALVMAAAASQGWARGFGGFLSNGPDKTAAHDCEADLCALWRLLSEPLLFSVIGSALDFRQISGETVPKALLVLVLGVIVRCSAAYFATCWAGLSTKERLFIALAWMPKATVQAALGSVPLDMARSILVREDDPDKYDQYEQHGIDILTTAVFSILLTAPVGLVVIQQLGPRWLQSTMTQVTPVECFSEGHDDNEKTANMDTKALT